MGWKYEVAIWTNRGGHVDYSYVTVYTGNSRFGMLRAYWANRSFGAVQVTRRA